MESLMEGPGCTGTSGPESAVSRESARLLHCSLSMLGHVPRSGRDRGPGSELSPSKETIQERRVGKTGN